MKTDKPQNVSTPKKKTKYFLSIFSHFKYKLLKVINLKQKQFLISTKKRLEYTIHVLTLFVWNNWLLLKKQNYINFTSFSATANFSISLVKYWYWIFAFSNFSINCLCVYFSFSFWLVKSINFFTNLGEYLSFFNKLARILHNLT